MADTLYIDIHCIAESFTKEFSDKKINEALRSLEKEDPYFTIDFFRKWGKINSWWPEDLLKKVSVGFPELVFSFEINGANPCKYFITQGFIWAEDQLVSIPKWPRPEILEVALKVKREEISGLLLREKKDELANLKEAVKKCEEEIRELEK